MPCNSFCWHHPTWSHFLGTRLLVVQRSCPLSCQQTLKQLAVGGMAAQNQSYSFHIVSHRFIQHASICLACPETGQARCETFLVSSTLACWLSVNSKVTTSPGSWPWKVWKNMEEPEISTDLVRLSTSVDSGTIRWLPSSAIPSYRSCRT